MARTACPRCREQGADGAGDNLAIYDDGHCFCFSCRFYLTSSSSSDNTVVVGEEQAPVPTWGQPQETQDDKPAGEHMDSPASHPRSLRNTQGICLAYDYRDYYKNKQ